MRSLALLTLLLASTLTLAQSSSTPAAPNTTPPLSPLPSSASPTAKEPIMSHHAHGTFEVNVKPLGPGASEDVTRFSIDKTLHGDLEATTRGEMYAAGNLKAGTAGYVAIETVTGTLAGRHGSFVLQHFATMDAAGPHMTVKITPGSGTGDLQGITGDFTITVAAGAHSYNLTYDLPAPH